MEFLEVTSVAPEEAERKSAGIPSESAAYRTALELR
jgi:hypothetical protein